VLLVDDGIATGSTMRASIAALKKMSAAKIIVAVPVGPPDTIEDLKKEVDELVCLFTPSSFMAVGLAYEQFPQISDEEVIELLRKSWR
jgi:predicted phosphoribosyltransferase